MLTNIHISHIRESMVMPGRRRAFYSRGPRPVINSIKNYVISNVGLTSTPTLMVLAKAVNTPLSTNSSDVSNGCLIKAVYVTIDVCGLGGTGVLNVADFYLIKNPGDNLTEPNPIAQGTSNEKKFIFRTWRAMIMRNQDGNVPYHWEGWIRIPKRYHRMGTDDTLILVIQCLAGLTGHATASFLYKWYR